MDAVKDIVAIVVAMISFVSIADTLIVSDSPTVVRNAEIREAIRQDSTWTAENIRANPYLFLQDQITACDRLKAKIEAQRISLTQMEKKACRTAEDALALITRYTSFLDEAKRAYKAADVSNSWPVTVKGYQMDKEELSDKIADSLERLDLAQNERKTNLAIAKKITIRKGTLKAKSRDLISLRRKLVQQAEQVKMNAALAELSELHDVLGTIKDMMIEIDEDPTKLTVEDLTAEDPNAKRSKAVNDFLNK